MEPTSVAKLAPGEAAYKGTLDASGEGAGGVWVHGTKEIADRVVSKVPPGGSRQTSYGRQPCWRHHKLGLRYGGRGRWLACSGSQRVHQIHERGGVQRQPSDHNVANEGSIETVGVSKPTAVDSSDPPPQEQGVAVGHKAHSGLSWQRGAEKGNRHTKALTRQGFQRPPLLPAKTEKELAVPMSRYYHNFFC